MLLGRLKIFSDLPKELLSGLVNRFQCSTCNATYNGKSYHLLKVRASEQLTAKVLFSDSKSTILSHLLTSHHLPTSPNSHATH